MIRDVLVVGAGAVGGYFGAHLAHRQLPVAFLLRGHTLAAVQQRGLTIRETDKAFTVFPACGADALSLPRPDLIVLATKANDLDAALDAVAPVVASHTIILTVQNGIDTEARVAARLGGDRVVGGVAYISSRVAAPGVIDVARRGSLAIGEVSGGVSERVSAIADLFGQAGVLCHEAEHLARTKWEKMCWNCVGNPLSVLLDTDIGGVMHTSQRPLIDLIVGEVAAVAAASGVQLRPDIAEQVVRRSEGLDGLRTSMYEDWRAGRPTEISHLNGFIVRQGQALGVATPINELVSRSISTLTASQSTIRA